MCAVMEIQPPYAAGEHGLKRVRKQDARIATFHALYRECVSMSLVKTERKNVSLAVWQVEDSDQESPGRA